MSYRKPAFAVHGSCKCLLSRIMPVRFGLGMRFLVCLVSLNAGTAFCQGVLKPTFPADDDHDDVGEVEEVVPDADVIPTDAPADATGKNGKLAKLTAQEAEELSYSQEELRSHFEYGGALTLGTGYPWQSYTLSFFELARHDLTLGMFAGSGQTTDGGIVDEKAYDIKIASHSAGLDARYYFSQLEHLSLQLTLGYGAWNGSISPHGSDDLETSDPDRLTASFRTSGPFVGFSAGLTWLWPRGFYLEWTPVGMRKSWIVSTDYTRSSDLVKKAVRDKIERPGIYGLTDLKFGYLF